MNHLIDIWKKLTAMSVKLSGLSLILIFKRIGRLKVALAPTLCSVKKGNQIEIHLERAKDKSQG